MTTSGIRSTRSAAGFHSAAPFAPFAFLSILASLTLLIVVPPPSAVAQWDDRDMTDSASGSSARNRRSNEDGSLRANPIYEWRDDYGRRNSRDRRDSESRRGSDDSRSGSQRPSGETPAVIQGSPAQPQPGQPVMVPPPDFQGQRQLPPGVPTGRQPRQPNQPGQQPPQGQPPQPVVVKRGFPTFYLDPADPQIRIGSETTVNVMLSNSESEEYDLVSFALQYNPEFLEVMDANRVMTATNVDDSVEGALSLNRGADSPYVNWVDERHGVIYFRGQPANGVSKEGGLLAAVTFRAIKESRRAVPAKFVFSAEPPSLDDVRPSTSLTRSGEDLLGLSKGQGGSVSAAFRILSEGDEFDAPLVRVDEGAQSAPVDGRYSTWMLLVPDRTEVAVGEEFNMDVLLYNPPGEPVRFDRINLYLHYDPETMEVVSLDRGISGEKSNKLRVQGDFTFDMTERNMVDHARGLIDFRARSTSESLTGSGRVLTLRFRALKESPAAGLRVGFSPGVNSPTTGLFESAQDRLGDPAAPGDAIYGGSVTVVSAAGA